ncbi:cyclic nucleotide-binding domain-containing protein [Pseudobutyrivibrio xylanivorans]|uniref:Cyclic nucleotide-binding domain-containing protein n=1 Tax=Pseudobutyrivibrio xylanivorans DSM 14809 TaxID=1123012 RepID=A0A1M6LC56_PSEXY|nr:cyclic nucleotide-binding domain-containing protein [Pseudobutyrivibrio xylanivorans]SHJ68675.1 Cyclic nucleotide-binding domain-containing protein [Pseudobutyrivibrio xylanivorans DSM 14809]
MDGKDKIFVAPEGMRIVVEGQPDSYLYIILSGRAYMYTGYGTKEETLIDKFGPGGCFGAFSMLTKQADIYTVVAQTDMKLIRLQEGDMGDFIKNNDTTVLSVMKGMAKDMTRMKSMYKDVNQELIKYKKGEKGDDSEPEEIILKDNSGTHRIYNPKNPHVGAKAQMRFLNRE